MTGVGWFAPRMVRMRSNRSGDAWKFGGATMDGGAFLQRTNIPITGSERVGSETRRSSMSGRLIRVACAVVCAALVAALVSAGALANTGPACFKITDGSGGFAHGTGVRVTNATQTSATVVVTYQKTGLCPLPGLLNIEWGRGKSNVDYKLEQWEKVGLGESDGQLREQRFELSGLTPNTVYSVRGVLSYGFNDYRTEAELFQTDPSLAQDLQITKFEHAGHTSSTFRWTFSFDPRASGYGTTLLSVIYGTGDKFQHRSRERLCIPVVGNGLRCDLKEFGGGISQPGVTVDGLASQGSDPSAYTTYQARIDLHNSISGDQLGPVFEFACNRVQQCRTVKAPPRGGHPKSVVVHGSYTNFETCRLNGHGQGGGECVPLLTPELSNQWLEQHDTRTGDNWVQVLAVCPESLPYIYEGFLSGNPYWSAVKGVRIKIWAVSNEKNGEGLVDNQLSFGGRPGDPGFASFWLSKRNGPYQMKYECSNTPANPI